MSKLTGGRLLEADISEKNAKNITNFQAQIGGWAVIRAWAFIRIVMVPRHQKFYTSHWYKEIPIVKMAVNYAMINRVGSLEVGFPQVCSKFLKYS